MNTMREKIIDPTFDYSQPWFYRNKLSLRCELGIGQGKEYFDNASKRAMKIANILFENKKIDAAFYVEYFIDGKACEVGNFGININEVINLDMDVLHSVDLIDEDIDTVKRYISYDIDFAVLEEIIKNQIENQYSPLVSFVSFDNQFIFSVYDDRGCDIVFFCEDKYVEFYPKLKDYFLDYDREKMKGTFESICSVCDECGSKFIKAKSKMMSLCPECAHILYGYENCNHQFKNGKCELCHWDGSRSDYIKKLVENNK